MPKKKVTFDRSEHLDRLRKMMMGLSGLPEFDDFMKEIHAEREAVIADLTADAVAGNDRLTLAAIGELRTYTAILSLYQAKITPPDVPQHND